MMKRSVALLCAAACLSACDGNATADTAPAAPAATPLTISNPYHDGLIKLDALRQGAALRQAIRAAKESCNRVERAAFQQDHANLKMWTATCQRTDYAVFLAPNGDVQVRKCSDAAVLKLPACKTGVAVAG